MERRDCLINAASPPPVYSDIHSVEPGMKPPPYTDVEEHPPCYSSPELTSPIVSTEPIQPQAITVLPSNKQPEKNQSSSCMRDFCQCCEATCEIFAAICLCCCFSCECLEGVS